MFAYCNNNPVNHHDSTDNALDTIFDLVSLASSIVESAVNPGDPWAWAGLAGDLVDVVIPFVGGAGETVRAISKAIDIIDDTHDTARVGEVIDTAGDIARKTDFYVAPTGDVIPASRTGFDANLSQMEFKNGKYYGFDYDKNPVRVRIEQHDATPGYTGPANPYHTSPHFHIDRREKGATGAWEKVYTALMEMLD